MFAARSIEGWDLLQGFARHHGDTVERHAREERALVESAAEQLLAILG